MTAQIYAGGFGVKLLNEKTPQNIFVTITLDYTINTINVKNSRIIITAYSRESICTARKKIIPTGF